MIFHLTVILVEVEQVFQLKLTLQIWALSTIWSFILPSYMLITKAKIKPITIPSRSRDVQQRLKQKSLLTFPLFVSNGQL